MALWGRNDADANTAPKLGVLDKKVLGNTAFGNVTVGSFRNDQAVGVFGVASGELANAAANAVSHAGWVKVVQGTGPVTSVTITNGGSGYANSDLVRVSGGTSNAAGTLVTNSSGGVTSITVTSGGRGFKSVSASTVAVTNSTGGASGGSSFAGSAVLGGRGGRVSMETLVAMGTITGDTDDTLFPDA